MFPSTHLSLLEALDSAPRREEAWRKFHEKYAPVIHSWCRRNTFDARSAEDLTQIIFLKLMRELPRYRKNENGLFREWLKTVVLHELIDKYLRPRKKEMERLGLRFVEPERLDATAGSLAEEICDREETLGRQLQERVRARVKESTWIMFHETVIEGRSVRDVAEEQRVTAAAVYKAQMRVKKLVYEELDHV